MKIPASRMMGFILDPGRYDLSSCCIRELIAFLHRISYSRCNSIQYNLLTDALLLFFVTCAGKDLTGFQPTSPHSLSGGLCGFGEQYFRLCIQPLLHSPHSLSKRTVRFRRSNYPYLHKTLPSIVVTASKPQRPLPGDTLEKAKNIHFPA